MLNLFLFFLSLQRTRVSVETNVSLSLIETVRKFITALITPVAEFNLNWAGEISGLQSLKVDEAVTLPNNNSSLTISSSLIKPNLSISFKSPELGGHAP